VGVIDLYQNLQAEARPVYPFGDTLSLAGGHRAMRDIAACPRYAPTPLRSLPGAARTAGVAAVLYKDEGGRFGVGSFKALGGAYAVALLLSHRVGQATGRDAPIAALARKEHLPITGGVTVTCASDGNHGRSVAAGAQVFGCRCVIFLHEGVSEGRAEAIRAFGAEVIRTRGTYDDSVRACAAAAAERGWDLISDTSWPGYEATPSTVMQGYSVMVIEALEQIRAAGDSAPSHVFVQAGVGGLAAAVTAHLWEELGERTPRIVVVEPDRADCLYQSAVAGAPTLAKGDLDTVMAGLSCGEVSLAAWRILQAGADAFMTISDRDDLEAMRLLGRGGLGDAPIVAGESAAAGLAGLLAMSRNPEAARALGLDRTSRVLLFGTEGATDPELYQRLMRDDPEEAARGART
jgi:diaminopropionate ammonia-lyase